MAHAIVNLSKDPDHIARWFPGHDLPVRRPAFQRRRHNLGADSIRTHEDSATGTASIVKGERSLGGEGIGSTLGDRQVAEPLNWNFDEKLARLGKPEEEPQIIVRPHRGETGPASAEDDPVWKNAPLAIMPRFKSLDGLRDKTTVRRFTTTKPCMCASSAANQHSHDEARPRDA